MKTKFRMKKLKEINFVALKFLQELLSFDKIIFSIKRREKYLSEKL